jgi:hypothetical protein
MIKDLRVHAYNKLNGATFQEECSGVDILKGMKPWHNFALSDKLRDSLTNFGTVLGKYFFFHFC